MARLPRLVIAGQLHLVMQRSHHAHPVFRCDEDFTRYLQFLREAAAASSVAVHAYALTPEQAILLVTPNTSTSLGRLFQTLGKRFGADYNRRHGRTGALWEGRFRATVVEAELHLLNCMRYVESAPVRLQLVESASEYPWSSAAHHIGRRTDGMIAEHPLYWRLGNTPFEREAVYTGLLNQPLPLPLQEQMAGATEKGWLLATPTFAEAMKAHTTRRLTPSPRGRPAKAVVGK